MLVLVQVLVEKLILILALILPIPASLCQHIGYLCQAPDDNSGDENNLFDYDNDDDDDNIDEDDNDDHDEDHDDNDHDENDEKMTMTMTLIMMTMMTHYLADASPPALGISARRQSAEFQKLIGSVQRVSCKYCV